MIPRIRKVSTMWKQERKMCQNLELSDRGIIKTIQNSLNLTVGRSRAQSVTYTLLVRRRAHLCNCLLLKSAGKPLIYLCFIYTIFSYGYARKEEPKTKSAHDLTILWFILKNQFEIVQHIILRLLVLKIHVAAQNHKVSHNHTGEFCICTKKGSKGRYPESYVRSASSGVYLIYRQEVLREPSVGILPVLVL